MVVVNATVIRIAAVCVIESTVSRDSVMILLMIMIITKLIRDCRGLQVMMMRETCHCLQGARLLMAHEA